MDYVKGNEVVIDGKELYIIDRQRVDDVDYIYTQKIEDDDLTDEYFIYELTDSPKLLLDNDKMKIVLQEFIKSLKQEMDLGDENEQ